MFTFERMNIFYGANLILSTAISIPTPHRPADAPSRPEPPIHSAPHPKMAEVELSVS